MDGEEDVATDRKGSLKCVAQRWSAFDRVDSERERIGRGEDWSCC